MVGGPSSPSLTSVVQGEIDDVVVTRYFDAFRIRFGFDLYRIRTLAFSFTEASDLSLMGGPHVTFTTEGESNP
jgi:hypothetical protein